MSDHKIDYSTVIRMMKWSFSRVSSFDSCKYKWFLHYIKGKYGEDMFFSSYGTFVHKLIEQYYKGELQANELGSAFLYGFSGNVVGKPPSKAVMKSYFDSGYKYFKDFKPFDLNMVSVEKKVDFQIDGVNLIGFIDFVGEKDGELYIIDNKSRNLSPRSDRMKPTKSDLELDKYLRQLYLYSEAIYKLFGRYPAVLGFNCFRSGTEIKEKFDPQKLEETKKWLVDSVNRITVEKDFDADPEWFKCTHLCEFHNQCEYYQMMKG